MQTNKSEYSIDFINRDVKDFPVTEPRETRHRVKFEDFALLVILVLTDAFGLIGLVLAPLVSAAIQNVFKYLVQPPIASNSSGQTFSHPNDATASLRERLEQAKKELGDHEQAPSLNIVNLMERLDHLIVESDRYFGSDLPDTRPAAEPSTSAHLSSFPPDW